MKKILPLLLFLCFSVFFTHAQTDKGLLSESTALSTTHAEAKAEVQRLFQQYMQERRKMLSEKKWQPVQQKYDSLFCHTFASFFDQDPKLGIYVLNQEMRRLENISPSWKTATTLLTCLQQLPSGLKEDPTVLNLKKTLNIHIYAREGAQIQDFTLQGLYGSLIDSRDYRGHYLLLDFWGSYCKPCIKKNELLRTHYAALQSKGLSVLTIMMDFSDVPFGEKELDAALEKDPSYPWPHAVLFKSKNSSGIIHYYRAYMLPRTILIDPKGQIIATNIEAPQDLFQIIANHRP